MEDGNTGERGAHSGYRFAAAEVGQVGVDEDQGDGNAREPFKVRLTVFGGHSPKTLTRQ